MVEEMKVVFTDKKVTAWGGMKLMKDMLDSIGIKSFMSGLDLPHKGSNRGYEAMQIIECFWTSIWIGAGRFSHSAIQPTCDMTKYYKNIWVEASAITKYIQYINMGIFTFCSNTPFGVILNHIKQLIRVKLHLLYLSPGSE